MAEFYIDVNRVLRGKIALFAAGYLAYRDLPEEKKEKSEWLVEFLFNILGELSLLYLKFIAFLVFLSQKTAGPIYKGRWKNVI